MIMLATFTLAFLIKWMNGLKYILFLTKPQKTTKANTILLRQLSISTYKSPSLQRLSNDGCLVPYHEYSEHPVL